MHSNSILFYCAAILSLLLTAPAWAQSTKPPIQITADLSDAPRKLFHAEIDLPVTAGPLTLITPKWIPGDHRQRPEASVAPRRCGSLRVSRHDPGRRDHASCPSRLHRSDKCFAEGRLPRMG